jgi:hypothetical protein
MQFFPRFSFLVSSLEKILECKLDFPFFFDAEEKCKFFNANTERHENSCSFQFNDPKERKLV